MVQIWYPAKPDPAAPRDPSLLSPFAPRLGLGGPIGARQAHDIVNAYMLAFFNRYLKGAPAALLDGSAERHPEALFESR